MGTPSMSRFWGREAGEGGDCMIVGSGEYYRRHLVDADLAHHLEAGLARHLDIEKDDVGPQLAYCFDCSESVVGSAHDFDAGFVCQQVLETLACESLVVSDQHAQRPS